MLSFAPADARKLCLERLCNRGVHEIVQVSSVLRNLTDDARADIGSLDRRHHKYGFETRRKIAIHERHLELVLEIADGAETSNDQRCADLPREIDEQALKLP